jgi:DNA-binding NarL/FixJ family response regulator
MIRVAVVDDHQVVRVGLQSLLSAVPDFEVAGVVVDGDEAVALP